MSRALITGAGGFIGQHLCARLRDAGWRIDAVSGSDLPAGVERVASRLTQLTDDDWRRLCDGCDLVFHLAGVAHGQQVSHERLTLVNVTTTERIAQAAVAVGVPAFVWLSSIKVLGDIAPEPLTADDGYAADEPYGQSKVAAERVLAEMSGDAGSTRLIVVRTPLVYGPGVGANFAALVAHALSAWPSPLGGAVAPRTLCGIENLLDFLENASAHPAGTYHVADAHAWTVSELIRAIAARAGRSKTLLPLPAVLMKSLLKAAGREAWYTRLFEPLRVDVSATTERTGWRPQRSADDMLGAVVDGYLGR